MIVGQLAYNVNTKITTHKYVVVLRVTILDGRERCLSSRVGLIRKSSNITRVIAVGPLELFQQKNKQTSTIRQLLPGHRH